MSKSFKEKVYNELKDQFDGYAYVIGKNKKGYLVGVASTEKELKELLGNSNVNSILACELEVGHVYYYLDKGKISKNQSILEEGQAKEFAVDQLYKSSEGGKNIRVLERQMIYSNRFVHNLNEFFSNRRIHCDLSSAYLPDNHDGRLPLFKLLYVMRDMYHLFVTGSQISLVTPSELVRIHDTECDVELEDLADLIVSMFHVDKDEFMRVLLL